MPDGSQGLNITILRGTALDTITTHNTIEEAEDNFIASLEVVNEKKSSASAIQLMRSANNIARRSYRSVGNHIAANAATLQEIGGNVVNRKGTVGRWEEVELESDKLTSFKVFEAPHLADGEVVMWYRGSVDSDSCGVLATSNGVELGTMSKDPDVVPSTSRAVKIIFA